MTTKPFLLNCWYVAAWGDELSSGQLLTRRLLGERVVLWRDGAGQVHALEDRCPHRFAPLSTGKVMDDGTLQCGYHGLRFGGDGECSHNPQGSGAIPKAAHVRAFPVVERHTAVWIWMGDPERADPARIVDYSILSRQPSEGYRTLHGHFTVQASYELEIDNLLDLSHTEYLHGNSIGTEAHHSAKYESFQEGETRVHSNRWFLEGPCPQEFARDFPTEGRPVEHWVNMVWDAPSTLMLHFGVTLTGRPREEGMNGWSGQLLTPETATSTHYFFTHTRLQQLDSVEVDEVILRGMRHAFTQEDGPMLETIQTVMGDADLWSLKPVLLEGDAGAVRARRLLEKLIAEERAARREPA